MRTGGMEKIGAFDPEAARELRYVLTDIDDTLTTDGILPAASYAALESLRDAGLHVVPVTGRPAGWCDMIARFWPVDAVVGENGAFYFAYDRERQTMRRTYFADSRERDANRRRLDAVRDTILAKVPGAAVAADQDYRVADLAIDFREDVAPLPPQSIDRIVNLFEDAGAKAKVSSIHVNGWFGNYDKLSMTGVLMRELFGIDLDTARRQIAFIGDSPNDEPMFEFFPLSVGVANVNDARERFNTLPSYVTQARGAAGFVEFAECLLSLRNETPSPASLLEPQ